MTTVEASLLGGRVEDELLPDVLLLTGPDEDGRAIWGFCSAERSVAGGREGSDCIGSADIRTCCSGIRGGCDKCIEYSATGFMAPG